MWLTRLAFWYLRNPRFTLCLGGFGPRLDPSFGVSQESLRATIASRVQHAHLQKLVGSRPPSPDCARNRHGTAEGVAGQP